ncbi:MAG: dethiobiotin synthase [Myxococcaceae bacterium]|nr:dethiobiotin synthase [Myxococcaceae bacterium]
MARRFFVTGTDTGVGKTQVSCALLRALARQGASPFAFKPFESGMSSLDAPGDSLALQAAAGGWQSLDTISLFRFRAPLAPGIAAKVERRPTSWARLLKRFSAFGRRPGVVEGAGGLHVPLDARHDVIDLMEALRLPVVVVARAGLGTVNHTTLTLDALAAHRLGVAAVVLVHTQPADEASRYNPAELQRRFPRVRFLGPVPFERDGAKRARAFDRVTAGLVRLPQS